MGKGEKAERVSLYNIHRLGTWCVPMPKATTTDSSSCIERRRTCLLI
jgi:hypothetical protein